MLSGSMVYRFGPFELDERRFSLTKDGVPVSVQPKAFDLLVALIRKRDAVVTKAELLQDVWAGIAVTKDSLAHAAMAVREALEDDIDAPRYIETVRGRGYRFIAPVVENEPRADGAKESTTPWVEKVPHGRAAVMRTLGEVLTRASGSKSGGLVFVTGEPGIGKSYVLDALAIAARDFRCASVRCHSEPGMPDLWPIARALRDLRTLGARFSGLVEAVADGELGRQRLDDDALRFELFEELVRQLAAAAGQRPVLLVLDDLHHADDRTLAFIGLLARQLRTIPIVVAAAYSLADARHSSFGATVGALRREPLATAVHLEPLGRDDIAEYLASVEKLPLSPALLDRVLEKTKGNPRFVVQLVHVIRTEERLRAGDVSTSALVGGDGMREAIMDHLTTLPESTKRVLTGAAVFRGPFDVAPFSASLGITNDEALRELGTAEAARVIVRTAPGRYRFSYPLVGDVLYKNLSAAERAHMHRRVAAALTDHLAGDESHERIGEIAGHLVEAAANGDVEAAVDWSLRAADLAAAAEDLPAAARYAERGLVALRFAQKPDAAKRARLLAAAGR